MPRRSTKKVLNIETEEVKPFTVPPIEEPEPEPEPEPEFIEEEEPVAPPKKEMPSALKAYWDKQRELKAKKEEEKKLKVATKPKPPKVDKQQELEARLMEKIEAEMEQKLVEKMKKLQTTSEPKNIPVKRIIVKPPPQQSLPPPINTRKANAPVQNFEPNAQALTMPEHVRKFIYGY